VDDNKDLKQGCEQYPTCVYRLELLEKWKEAVEKRLDGLMKLLLANLSGVVLTLLAIIGAMIVYVVEKF